MNAYIRVRHAGLPGRFRQQIDWVVLASTAVRGKPIVERVLNVDPPMLVKLHLRLMAHGMENHSPIGL